MTSTSRVRRLFSFTGFAQGLGNGTFAGTQLDTDLDQTNNAVNDLAEVVRRVVRADGKLANGSVGRNALAADVRLGLGPSKPWVSDSDYDQDDTVTRGAGLYRALNASTGSDPASTPSTWELVADLSQAVTINDGSISRSKITAKAVGNDQIDDGAVTGRTIRNGTIEAKHAYPTLGVVPVGTMVDFAGIAPPSNWRWANGDFLVRGTYPDLFEALTYRVPCNLTVGSDTLTSTAVQLGGLGLLGAAVEGPGIPPNTTLVFITANFAVLSNQATQTLVGALIRFCPYGNGADGFSFQLPDTRGRLIAGRDDMGGAPAGRLNSIGGDRLSSTGGSEGRTLTLANLPVTLPGGSVTVTYPQTTYVTYGQLDVVQPGTGTNVTNLWRNTKNTDSPVPDPRTFSFGLSNPGGGQAFNVLPPLRIANKIIFLGA